MDDKQKKRVLAAAVVLLALTVGYRIMNPYIQDRVGTLTFENGGGAQVRGGKTVKSSDAMVLTNRAQSDSIVSRWLNRPSRSGKIVNDLFASIDKVERPEETVTITETFEPVELPVEIKVAYDPVQRAKEHISSFTFLGTYKSAGKRAIFMGKDKLVLVVRAGDRIDGNYLVEEITDSSVRIKALDINETIHLDIREFNNE
jgi:hypothetical protein